MSRYHNVHYDQLNHIVSDSDESDTELPDQSVNQSINQSFNRPANQSINRSANQSINHSYRPYPSRLVDEEIVYDQNDSKKRKKSKIKQQLTSDSDDQTINRAINQLDHKQSINQSSNQSVNQSNNQSVSQLNRKRSIDHSIIHSNSDSHRSINQSTSHSNKPINDRHRSINQSINQSHNDSHRSINQPITDRQKSFNLSIIEDSHQSTNQSLDDELEDDSDSTQEETSLLRNQSIYQSINQPNQRALFSPARSVNQSHSIQIAQSPGISHRTVAKLGRSQSISQPTNQSINQSTNEKAPLSLIIGISLYWFGWSALNFPLLVVIIPMQARMLAEQSINQSVNQSINQSINIGSALSQTLMLGSLLSAIAGPLFGSYSDSNQSINGRRKPFLIFGTILLTVSLIGLSQSINQSMLSFFFIFFSIANAAIISPYSALVPDLIGRSQRGQASGWLGFFSMAGNLFGGAVAAYVNVLGIPLTYIVLLMVHNLAMYGTLRLIDEKPYIYEESINQSINQSISKSPARRWLSMLWPFGSSQSINQSISQPVTSTQSTNQNHQSLNHSNQSVNQSMNQSINQKPPTGFRRILSLFSPFLNHDFRVVFFVRFLFQMGCLTVQEFLLFYLHDQIGQQPVNQSIHQSINPSVNTLNDFNQPVNQSINHNDRIFTVNGVILATSSEQAITLLFIPVMFGALISSLISGIISDNQSTNHSNNQSNNQSVSQPINQSMSLSKKSIVYYSGWLMIAVAIMFSVTRNYGISLVLGGLFGIGFGAFSTMEWALCTDVLPNPIEFAKDMGIWSLSLVVPQILAVPIAGHLLDFASSHGYHTLGYSAIFLAAAGYFTLGTFAVKRLETD